MPAFVCLCSLREKREFHQKNTEPWIRYSICSDEDHLWNICLIWKAQIAQVSAGEGLGALERKWGVKETYYSNWELV